MTAVHPDPRLAVNLPVRALTLDEVAILAAADELHRYELDEGTLLVIPPADAEHVPTYSCYGAPRPRIPSGLIRMRSRWR